MAEDHSQRYDEVIFTGFGGQGIIMAGNILGKAASLYEHRNATLIQSYGPEARGGACAAQVVISDTEIEYPYIEHPGILVCMSQEGFETHIRQLPDHGRLFFDRDLVKFDPDRPPTGADVHGIAATELAREMGVKMMANIIMVGFLCGVTQLVSLDALARAVETSVPPGTVDKNQAGLREGYQTGQARIQPGRSIQNDQVS